VPEECSLDAQATVVLPAELKCARKVGYLWLAPEGRAQWADVRHLNVPRHMHQHPTLLHQCTHLNNGSRDNPRDPMHLNMLLAVLNVGEFCPEPEAISRPETELRLFTHTFEGGWVNDLKLKSSTKRTLPTKPLLATQGRGGGGSTRELIKTMLHRWHMFSNWLLWQIASASETHVHDNISPNVDSQKEGLPACSVCV
jgi:hypothetical protein